MDLFGVDCCGVFAVCVAELCGGEDVPLSCGVAMDVLWENNMLVDSDCSVDGAIYFLLVLVDAGNNGDGA